MAATTLPQLSGRKVITDAGLETQLVFEKGVELPEFASFPLLFDSDGRKLLTEYNDTYATIARRHNAPLLLETPTWRASREWVARVGMRTEETAAINRVAVEQFHAYGAANPDLELIVSGCIGPRGDGYVVDRAMTSDQAADYHREQIAALHSAGAHFVSAFTLNYAAEGMGIAKAAKSVGASCVLSFTVETNGQLPSGQTIGDAIEEIDRATNSSPLYYMINCAHPTHFADALEPGTSWIDRIKGLRANASMLSHEELDASETLDDGDPADLAARIKSLVHQIPSINVLGGCCGTDHRHVGAIAEAFFA